MFCHELAKPGLKVARQVKLPITYDGLVFEEGLRLDVVVADLVVCELKAVELMNKVYTAQLISQLKLANKRSGFLINFNVSLIKDGIQRIVC